MKRAIARAIVRYRLPVMIVILAIAAWAATMIGATNINYDINRYLSDDTVTKRSLAVMEEEFGSNEQLRVMFEDLGAGRVDEIVGQLGDLEQVRLAVHDPQTDVRTLDGIEYSLVTLTLADCDATAFVEDLRTMFPEDGDYFVGGTVATQLDVQRAVGEEMPLVLAVSFAVVLAVLLATSQAWLEPLVILLVLVVSIVINMGTNFVFDDVSFITFAVCAVLQLALSIDYAIMLLHTYDGLRDAGMTAEGAMEEALVRCFMRIASSALTTVAGLMSLLFMSFTIGFDIGVVLSKGILISMVCVFLLMPAVVLLFEGPLVRTRHKPLRLGGDHLATFVYGARAPLAALLMLAVAGGALLSSQNSYTFTNDSVASKSATVAVNKVFGSTNPVVVLVPGGTTDEDYDRQRDLVERLESVELADGGAAIGEVQAMVTTGAAALEYYTAQDVAELTGMGTMPVKLFFKMQGFGDSVRADELLAAADGLADESDAIAELRAQLDAAHEAFDGPRYTRMLFDVNFSTTDERFYGYMDELLDAVRSVYGQDFYVTGFPMSNYDIGNAFQGDLLKVNAITFAAILAIVMLSFRSVVLPLLLVFVIEGAIWITMGASRVIGEPIFFISYLICVSMQMGATIDYAILLSDQYRRLRRGENEPAMPAPQALSTALEHSLPTILTSGIILTTAGFIVGQICSVYYISSIGSLLSRGAFVSVVLVLTLLPALLVLCDRFVARGGRGASVR